MQAALNAGIQCSNLDTIDPDDMDVTQMMSLCRASGVSYRSVFDTRSSTASTTSDGSNPSAAHSRMK